MKKSDREIMEILEAFDATGVAHSAAPLCQADPKTVRRYALARDLGRPAAGPVVRPKLIDPFLDKIEEWVDRAEGKVRADVVHERLAAMGFTGNERTTRRAVAAAKARWRAGHRRTYRPWSNDVSGRPHHRILHPAPAPRGPKPHTPAQPRRRRTPAGADPQPRTGFSRRHGVPEGTSDFCASALVVAGALVVPGPPNAAARPGLPRCR